MVLRSGGGRAWVVDEVGTGRLYVAGAAGKEKQEMPGHARCEGCFPHVFLYTPPPSPPSTPTRTPTPRTPQANLLLATPPSCRSHCQTVVGKETSPQATAGALRRLPLAGRPDWGTVETGALSRRQKAITAATLQSMRTMPLDQSAKGAAHRAPSTPGTGG